MAENSAIEWTDHTFNPWWGCTKVSPGCDHCYAAALDKRTGGDHWGAGAPRRRTKDWSGPRRWQKHAGHFAELHDRRQRVFCASMADVFDNEVPDAWLADLWQLIRETPGLDWIIVTKRIGNVAKMVPADWPQAFPHVCLCITVVNQAEADRDVPKLLATPVALRGISAEPLLGPIDFTANKLWHAPCAACQVENSAHPGSCTAGKVGLDWIKVGGESGAGARPMVLGWAKDILRQCKDAGVPVFMKQVGAHPTNREGERCTRVKHKKGADMAEWPEELRVRETPFTIRKAVA